MYLLTTPVGYVLTDENFTIINSYTLANASEVAAEYFSIEKGNMTSNLEMILKRIGKQKVNVVNKPLFELLNSKGYHVSLVTSPEVLSRVKLIQEKISKERFAVKEDYYSYLKDVATELTRMKVREEQQTRDKLAIQVIETINDLDKSANLLVGRLSEWYGLYFPELYKIINDNELFVKILSEVCLKKELDEGSLTKFNLPKEKIKKIIDASKHSIGAELEEEDVLKIKNLAKTIREVYERRRDAEKYLEQLMKEIAPNLYAIAGATIGARLIAKAGGLKRLSELPASTIQVLGAERALFKHLKFGAKPPKHGILFQHPLVHSSPKWNRGKVARLLANKIALAARLDFYGQREMSETLKKEVEEKAEAIKKLPPKSKKKVKKK